MEYELYAFINFLMRKFIKFELEAGHENRTKTLMLNRSYVNLE